MRGVSGERKEEGTWKKDGEGKGVNGDTKDKGSGDQARVHAGSKCGVEGKRGSCEIRRLRAR